ncbi:MAG: quinonprotein alcohol dehydrogenase, partial [Betaproteobacteria bacterium]
MHVRNVFLVAILSLLMPLAHAQPEVSGATTSNARPITTPIRSVTQQMLDAAASDPKNWIHSNGSYDQQRFYPGKQIDTKNVGKLRPAFVFQTAVLESMETAPIVVDGI